MTTSVFPRSRFPLLGSAFVFCLVNVACGEDFPLDEYEKNASTYLSSLEGLALSMTETDYALDGSKVLSYDRTVISKAGHFRVKTIGRIKTKDGTEKQKTEWVLLRPDGYYQITQIGEGRFVLNAMKQGIPTIMQVEPSSPLAGLQMPLNLNTFLPIGPLIRGEFAKTHSAKVTNFHRAIAKGEPFFTFQSANSFNGRKGESKVQLSEHWLVTNVRTKSLTTGVQRKTEISYTKLGARVLPARITVQLFDATGKPKGPPSVTEFQDYREFAGRSADFSLRQFGLPETSSAYRDGSRWYLWFLAFALASLGVGWYFRRRARLRSVQAPATS